MPSNIPELLVRPDLGKRGYRLKCRFTVEAYTRPEAVNKLKFKVAELWVQDMYKQGFDYDPNVLPMDERGFKLVGPFVSTPITGLPKTSDIRPMSGREALRRVLTGDPLRDTGKNFVANLPAIHETDKWEYEISAVFVHTTLMAEIPDSHEEDGVNRTQ